MGGHRDTGRSDTARATLILSVVLALAGAFVSLVLAMAPRASADATGTACSLNDQNALDMSRQIRCINHLNLLSRGFVKAPCITSPDAGADRVDPLDDTPVYLSEHVCGSNGRGAEAIAHARYLNRSGGAKAGFAGLQSNYQYEVDIPNAIYNGNKYKRADILYYAGTSAATAGQIQVLEVKGSWNGTMDDTRDQVRAYIAGLNATYGAEHAVPAFKDVASYTDRFEIELAKCQSGDTQKRYERYFVTAPEPGILYVDRTFDPCQNPAVTPPPSEQNQEGESFSEEDRDRSVPADSGGASGDPHMTTLDGLRYDLQSTGEFDLAVAPRFGLRVQARLIPNHTWSALDRVAVAVGAHRVELARNGDVLLDGSAITVSADDPVDLGDDNYLLRSDDGDPLRYYITWSGGVDRPGLVFQPGGASALVGMAYPQDGTVDLTGLLGNVDGNPLNDLKLRDGTSLGSNPSPTTIHGSFANSWRITDATSLFTYDAGKNTASYTDLSFPPTIFTINDVDQSARDLSINTCQQQGVLPGPQFDDCVLDVARTQNTQFAQMAAEYSKPLLGLGDARVNSTGSLDVDFEGSTVPPNFDSGQLATDSHLTKVAGPFSGTSTYRFYVPGLPPHVHGDLSFDLVAFGDWTDSTVEQLRLAIDNNTTAAWTQRFGDSSPQLTPTTSGTSDSGTPYTVYRVDVPFDQSAPQLSAVLSATGVDGLANKAFGIDNIHFAVTIIPPQTFDLGTVTSTATTISDGQPGAGAGNLETNASEDDYTFHLAAAARVNITREAVSGSAVGVPNYALVAADGSYVGTGWNAPPLPAGDYTIKVTADSNSAHTGAYRLVLAAPQTFGAGTVTSSSPIAISGGQPAAGAGSLESSAAEDDYSFHLASAGSLVVTVDSCSAGGGLWWQLDNASGSSIHYDGTSCSSGYPITVSNLAAGDYLLQVPPTGSTTTYHLTLAMKPAPQTFDLGTVTSTATTISDGQPGAGAGNLETNASEDDYTFHLAAAARVNITREAVSGSAVGVPNYALVAADGSYVGTGWNAPPLPAGDYTIKVTADSNSAHTGAYRLVLAAPQTFGAGTVTSSSPIAISGGQPAAGAGSLESSAAEDDYSFHLASAGSLVVTVDSCSAGGGLWWQLDNASGSSIHYDGTSCSSGYPITVSNLAAGDYLLQVPPTGSTTTYHLTLAMKPAPQTFDLGTVTSTATTISDGQPGAGAGNLETNASEDDYTFHLAAAARVNITREAVSGSAVGVPNYALVAADGSYVGTGWNAPPLPAGDYTIKVTADSNSAHTGAYRLVLAAPQTFGAGTVTSSSPIAISGGQPAAGAGSLESSAAEDDYSFHLASAGSLVVTVDSCSAGGGLWWQLDNASGSSIHYDGTSCSSGYPITVSNLAAGDYLLQVPPTGSTTTYHLTLAMKVPHASFTSYTSYLSSSFDGSPSGEPGGSIASYAWSFGDGSTGSGPSPSHTYDATGAYTVSLTVTDADGATDSISRTVSVTAPNQAPVAAFTSSASGLTASLNGSGSSDPDGTIASYSWNFGDSSTGSGATPSHTYASAGTYTVALTVTDNKGATGTVSHSVTVTAPNQAPVAAFTSSASGLTASLNGSGSSDPDGTIASYSWNFGDSSTGSGATPSHTYASAGTYTVALTVTDNKGATGTVSHSVTVTAPNQAPVAAFTSSASGLTASLNGSGSSDPDGTIASYSWNFGDSSTGSGATPSHTYASAGTYTVALTVTDNKGATGTVSHTVTITGIFASDAFARTVSSGWGSADTGGAWTLSGGASNFSVSSGGGKMQRSAAGSDTEAFLNGLSIANTNSTVDMSLSKAATGGGDYETVVARHSGTSDYRFKVHVLSTGAVQVSLTKMVSGSETALTTVTVSGLTYTANLLVHLRFKVTGTATVSLSGKAWTGSSEPTGWTTTATDSSSPLAIGAPGLISYLSSTATNAPVITTWDTLSIAAT